MFCGSFFSDFGRRIAPILAGVLLISTLGGCAGAGSGSGDGNVGDETSESSRWAAGSGSDGSGASGASGPSGTSGAPGTGDPASGGAPEIALQYGDVLAWEGGSGASVDDPAIAAIENGAMVARGVGQTTVRDGGREYSLTVSPAEVDVVLFTGQSNMVGRETSRYSVDIPSGQAYEFKYLTNSLTGVQNPVGETFGEVEVSSGSSVVPQFCADYVAATGRKIVAVHVARGGRAISSFDPRGGTVYPDVEKKYSACVSYLEESPNFTLGRRFYVMYQGESDTTVGTEISTYKSRYTRFHNRMTDTLGMEFGALISNGRNTTDNREGILRIQQAKAELAAEADDLILADLSAYNWYILGDRSHIRDDLVHLNADGLRAVASEACKNIVNYLGYGPDPALAGVDPVTYLKAAGSADPADPQSYRWEFEDGEIAGATRTGTVTPVIADGRYVNDQNSHVRYALERPIVLSADRDFSIEWKGFSYRNMNEHASILLSGGDTVFLTFQEERGVYLRCGEQRFDISSSVNPAEIYKDHVWRVVYAASERRLSVYLDGTLIKTGSWSSDLVFTDLLGCSVGNKYTFVGELDYLRITV